MKIQYFVFNSGNAVLVVIVNLSIRLDFCFKINNYNGRNAIKRLVLRFWIILCKYHIISML